MSLITTNDGRIIFKKAESVMLVPYFYDTSRKIYVLDNLNDEVYDISAIIGDTITIEMSDGNTEAKYNEFKASPLIESVSGSKFSFTAECIDLQNAVLRSAFGAMTPTRNIAGLAAMQEDFVLMYVLFRIRFSDANIPDVYLPKVKLNSKLLISQLKARVGQGNISGTAIPVKIAIDRGEYNWLEQFQDRPARTSRFCPNTPVLFVPRDKTPFFFAWEKDSGNLDRYSTIDFENGSVKHDILVDEQTGDWSQL